MRVTRSQEMTSERMLKALRLWSDDGARVDDIALQLSATSRKAQVHRALRKLVKDGHAERIGDPGTRALYRITVSGRAELDKAAA